MAADGTFPEASVTYDVEIREASYSLSGWVGANGTDITLAGNLANVTLCGTSLEGCNITGPAGCDDYQSQVLEDYTTAPSLTGCKAVALDRPGYYLSRYDDYATKTGLASQSRIDSSMGAQFVEFNGRLWKLGGGSSSVGANNKILLRVALLVVHGVPWGFGFETRCKCWSG